MGFYRNKHTALKASLKVFVFDKLSDFFFLVAFVIYYLNFGTFYFEQKQTITGGVDWIPTFILLTAFVKSAQFCFYF